MPQLPPVQKGVPWLELQTLEQPPQWEGSVSRFDSQPLLVLASQLP